MSKTATIFDFINSICYKKDIAFDKKACSGYMLALWVSHDRELIGIANDINPYIFEMSDEAIYKYFWHKVPKGKRYIKWIKKEPVSNKKKKEVQELVDKYSISKREAELSLIGE